MGSWRLRRPPRSIVALVALLATLAGVQTALVVTRAAGDRGPAPIALGSDLPEEGLRALLPRRSTPSARPSPSPTPPPTPPRRAAEPPLAAFAGLGAWIDVYDFDIDPVRAVAVMKARGVGTLYLQTGRFNTRYRVAPENEAWLIAAHAAGLKVVGWYLPSYKDMAADVRRTVAVARYRAQGERFDALGVDIEWKNDVKNPEWNRRVVEHLRRVRAELGAGYPVAAIVPPPLQMDVAPRRWAGFPWRGIARWSDVVMLMSYWSFRDCPDVPDHCAYPFTLKNVRETRRLMGSHDRPVHSIGGVGDRITRDEVEDFVRGARDGRAFGASLYDFRTTESSWWPLLRQLATLGPA